MRRIGSRLAHQVWQRIRNVFRFSAEGFWRQRDADAGAEVGGASQTPFIYSSSTQHTTAVRHWQKTVSVASASVASLSLADSLFSWCANQAPEVSLSLSLSLSPLCTTTLRSTYCSPETTTRSLRSSTYQQKRKLLLLIGSTF